MRVSLKSIWKTLWLPVFLLGSVFFIVRYFHGQAEHVVAPEHFAWHFLALGVGLQAAYWILNTLCWQWAVYWYAGVRLGPLQSFSQLAMSTLGKYFPGKIWGMVARASLLAQLGVTARQSLFATLNEQFLILYSAFLSSAALWCLVDHAWYSVAMFLAVAACLPVLGPLQKFGFKLAPRFLRLGAAADVADIAPLGLKKFALLALSYSAIWLLVGSIFCCVYYLFFPAQPDPSVIIRLIVANTIGISIGFFAVFSPGGLGIREAITSSLLTTQMNLEQAILLCLLFRLWIVAFELLSGLTLLIPHKTLTAKQVP